MGASAASTATSAGSKATPAAWLLGEKKQGREPATVHHSTGAVEIPPGGVTGLQCSAISHINPQSLHFPWSTQITSWPRCSILLSDFTSRSPL